jgi:hypothetical protein
MTDTPAGTPRPAKDPQRQRDGRLGAAVSWSRTRDRAERTRPAREAADARFYEATDPALPEQVRQQMADAARRAHFMRMWRASAEARRRKSGQ